MGKHVEQEDKEKEDKKETVEMEKTEDNVEEEEKKGNEDNEKKPVVEEEDKENAATETNEATDGKVNKEELEACGSGDRQEAFPCRVDTELSEFEVHACRTAK